MTRRARRTHAPAFKAKVALAAIKGEKTLAGAQRMMCTRTDHGLEGKVLHAKIGELTSIFWPVRSAKPAC